MPTVFSHAIIGLAAASVFQRRCFVSGAEEPVTAERTSWWQALEAGQIPLQMRFVALSIFCSVLPDADVVAFVFDIPYGHAFGHRGFFHSLCFALMLAVFVVVVFFPRSRITSASWWFLAGYFFLLTASHGLLDTLTQGGFGIALFAPFDHTRYLAPVTLFQAAPLHLSGLFTPWGMRCIRDEFFMIWVPTLVVLVWVRRHTAANRKPCGKPLAEADRQCK